jgi:hypothetical protein
MVRRASAYEAGDLGERPNDYSPVIKPTENHHLNPFNYRGSSWIFSLKPAFEM